MIIHLVNGAKITISEENNDNYINAVEFGPLVSIKQRARERKYNGVPDEWTRLTINEDQLLFIEYENEKCVVNHDIPFAKIEFRPDHFTAKSEILPDVKEELTNG